MSRRWSLLVVLVLLGGCSAGSGGAFLGLPARAPDITAAAVTAHLAALQAAADAHGGNRTTGSAGYAASVAYLRGKLDAAGFRTRLQEVPLPSVWGSGAGGRTIVNLIADRPGGDEGAVLLTGAHLDSVGAGPGINDNGSGAAAVLEVALTAGPARQHLRFAWWGGEEQGLLGSTAYVGALPAADRKAIAGYLNVDMIGSPNAGYFVYDGDDSDRQGAGAGPAGSAAIETALVTAFGRLGVATEGTDFDGRSDYGPFVAAGIPSGGTFTGAEGVKTPAQAAKWGGTAGQPYDRCYHSACDTTANVDPRALERNARALAAAVRALAG